MGLLFLAGLDVATGFGAEVALFSAGSSNRGLPIGSGVTS